MAYTSRALRNVTTMARGSTDWLVNRNDHWHWFKHARPWHLRGLPEPDMVGIPSEDDYITLAAAICVLAADELTGTEVRMRDASREGSVRHQFLVWYQTQDMARGLFLVVDDCGDHGELVTMFSPDDGYDYYEAQEGHAIN